MAASVKKKDKELSPRNRRQRSRNLAMLAILGGLSALFYIITIVKLGSGGG